MRTLFPVRAGHNFHTKLCDVRRAIFFNEKFSFFAMLSTTVSFLAIIIKTILNFYLNKFQNC